MNKTEKVRQNFMSYLFGLLFGEIKGVSAMKKTTRYTLFTIIITIVATAATMMLYAQTTRPVAEIKISPRNTVLLDPNEDGTGIGLPLHPRLEPGNAYRIRVEISGKTGGPTRSVFIWMGGYIDDSGKDHETKYMVAHTGTDLEFYYPRNIRGSGPVVLAFFADACEPNDNSAAGTIRIIQVN